MKLTPPKVITFWIAIVLAVLGVIAEFKVIGVLEPYSFLLVIVAFVLLVLGLVVKGL